MKCAGRSLWNILYNYCASQLVFVDIMRCKIVILYYCDGNNGCETVRNSFNYLETLSKKKKGSHLNKHGSPITHRNQLVHLLLKPVKVDSVWLCSTGADINSFGTKIRFMNFRRIVVYFYRFEIIYFAWATRVYLI